MFLLKGLFHQVILQSGSALAPWAFDDVQVLNSQRFCFLYDILCKLFGFYELQSREPMPISHRVGLIIYSRQTRMTETLLWTPPVDINMMTDVEFHSKEEKFNIF